MSRFRPTRPDVIAPNIFYFPAPADLYDVQELLVTSTCLRKRTGDG
jgi:hypothetical protein